MRQSFANCTEHSANLNTAGEINKGNDAQECSLGHPWPMASPRDCMSVTGRPVSSSALYTYASTGKKKKKTAGAQFSFLALP